MVDSNYLSRNWINSTTDNSGSFVTWPQTDGTISYHPLDIGHHPLDIGTNFTHDGITITGDLNIEGSCNKCKPLLEAVKKLMISMLHESSGRDKYGMLIGCECDKCKNIRALIASLENLGGVDG